MSSQIESMGEEYGIHVAPMRVEFVDPWYVGTVPYEMEIETIYRAYRSCWSPDLCLTPELTVTQQNELMMKYREQLARLPQWGGCRMTDLSKVVEDHVQGYLERVSYEQLCRHLARCEFIAKHRHHESPLEHAKMTVDISGISRANSHQLVRHRLASFSQRSQRYISEDNPDWVIPMTIADNPEAFKVLSDWLKQAPAVYQKLKDLGIPSEDARYAIPQAIPTRIVMTANFREWIHILGERCCSKAQSEIRSLMNMIWWYLTETIPFIFDDIIPKCEKLGHCPEAKTCGLYARNHA